jgi:hypothetical protein
MDDASRAHVCPEAEAFAAFLCGALDDAAARALQQHVDVCAACRRLLSELARFDDGAAAPSLYRPDATHASTSLTLPRARDDFALYPGARVGRYVVRRRLGAGAMGVVYEAHDPELERKLAIKVLRARAGGDERDDAPVRERLLGEAKAMAQLAHANVVTVHDVGQVGERVFIAMELVDGETLTAWLAARPRSRREIIATFVAAGRGLLAAHMAGLVHRDFKPDNVLVGRDGRVLVTDFGLAHSVGDAAPATSSTRARRIQTTATRELAGTPFYMAPEQQLGQATDARSDQFAFCVALWAALAGEHPYGPRPFEQIAEAIAAGRSGPAPSRRERLPRWLRAVLLRGLQLAPEARHPTMAALLASLTRDRRRHAWIAVAATVSLSAVAVAGAWSWRAHTLRRACSGAAEELAGIWDAARERAVGHAFIVSGRPRAGAIYGEVTQRLGRYSRDWLAMRAESCAAARGRVDPAVVERRRRCLDARRYELRQLTDRLVTADATTVGEAATEAGELGELAACLDDRALASATRPELTARPGPALVPDDHAGSEGALALARHDDGTLWRGALDGRGWHDALAVVAGGSAGPPVLARDATGAPFYLVRKGDGLLWLGQRDGAVWHDAPVSARDVAGDPALLLDGDRRPTYFVRKRDGALWYGARRDGGGWREQAIAADVDGTPDACVDREGRLTYVVRRADGSLWHGWQERDGRWRDEKLDDGIAGDPVLALDAVDKLTAFARLMDGSLRGFYQVEAGSAVWNYVPLAPAIVGNPTLIEDAARQQHVFARTADGALWHGWQSGPARGPWHDETLARDVAGDPAVARIGGRLAWVVRAGDGSWRSGELVPTAPSATTAR